MTLNGALVAGDNSDTQISGTITNTGSIEINSLAFQSDLELGLGGATLTGGGTVTLSGAGAGIDDVSGTQLLTVTDQTIQGQGNVGRNTIDIINQAGGLFDANVDGESLILDATSGGFINSGTLRASNGGILELRDGGTVDFANAGGTIEAQNGSEVLLTTEARIVGGVLSTTGTGQFRVAASQNANLEDVTLNGALVAGDNSDTQISGTITNTGSIEINSLALQSDLELGVDGATLTGGGTVTLSGANAGINDVSGTQLLTVTDQTIQGQGNVGRNTIDIINQAGGLFDANVDGESLILDATSGGFINSGTLRASNGGILELRDGGTVDFANAGGTIEAQNGSEVLLTTEARIVGGVLSTTGTGQFRVAASQNANLEDVTLNGALVAGDNSDTQISGTITNTGSIEINSLAFQSDLELGVGGATLTGGGTVTLSGANAGINDVSGTQTLTVADQTIQGRGNIGRNTINLINNSTGTILANDATGALIVDVSSAIFSNDGTLGVASDATLEIIGDLAGSDSSVLFGDGTIVATGGVITHDGLITPGEEVGILALDASLLLDPNAEISIEIGGILAGTEFDLLTISDDLTLDGDLSISLTDGFNPLATDTFEIITSTNLSGTFANVSNGGTLRTLDGLGEFTVNFGAGSSFGENRVVLSSFSVPEPASAVFLTLSGLAMLGRRRRKN